MRLLVATTNANKVREIRIALEGAGLQIVTLTDLASVPPEPDETGATFWENARIKALAYAEAAGCVAVAEDSGLEIDALGGEPGVRSARFLGQGATYPERFAAIYARLNALGPGPFAARFVTALAVADGATLIFETLTRIEGVIAPAPAGSGGFGYDPIFHYGPLAKTTAEMTAAEKAAVSHRGRAFRDLRRALAPGGAAAAGGPQTAPASCYTGPFDAAGRAIGT